MSYNEGVRVGDEPSYPIYAQAIKHFLQKFSVLQFKWILWYVLTMKSISNAFQMWLEMIILTRQSPLNLMQQKQTSETSGGASHNNQINVRLTGFSFEHSLSSSHPEQALSSIKALTHFCGEVKVTLLVAFNSLLIPR